MQDHEAKLDLNMKKTETGDDTVIVVGRYFYEPYDLMAVEGDFSMDRLKPGYYDCGELFLTDCLFHQCCEGAPLIILSGEVIGIVFYEDSLHSPVFLVNMIYKWWEHYKIFGEKRHPCYGFEGCDFYAAELATLDRVMKQFPNVSEGIVVTEVHRAHSELRKDDVIVKCDDKFVEKFSEFWDLIWEKVGQRVKLLVARVGTPTLMTIDILVLESTKVNKWLHLIGHVDWELRLAFVLRSLILYVFL